MDHLGRAEGWKEEGSTSMNVAGRLSVVAEGGAGDDIGHGSFRYGTTRTTMDVKMVAGDKTRDVQIKRDSRFGA
jgi:hypothetical protein